MLASDGEGRPNGLPGGTTTALIGDEGTRKASLAEYFLAEAYAGFPDLLDEVLTMIRGYKAQDPGPGSIKAIGRFLRRQREKLDDKTWARKRLKDWRWPAQRLAIPGRVWPEPMLIVRMRALRKLAKQEWRIAREDELRVKVEALSQPLMTRWDSMFYSDRCSDVDK